VAQHIHIIVIQSSPRARVAAVIDYLGPTEPTPEWNHPRCKALKAIAGEHRAYWVRHDHDWQWFTTEPANEESIGYSRHPTPNTSRVQFADWHAMLESAELTEEQRNDPQWLLAYILGVDEFNCPDTKLECGE
jgi:hypothetical protein